MFSIFFVSCLVSRFLLAESEAARAPKFLSYETSLDGDIAINLDFTIPFVKVPIKRTMETAFGANGLGFPTVSFNIVGLVLGGVVTAGLIFLLPLLLRSYAVQYPAQRYAKILDSAEFSGEGILELTKKMYDEGYDFPSCAKLAACVAGRQASSFSAMKTLKEWTGNDLVSSMVNTTMIEDALKSGWRGEDCSENRCPIKSNQLETIFSLISHSKR